MNPSDNYKPCFAHVPDDWKGRWELLREFVRRWHGIPLGPVGITSPVIEQEQTRLGMILPPSFCEWIAFAFEAENIFALVFPVSDVPQKSILLIEVWKPIPRHHIPACILANLNRGGAFHGMLVPKRNQA